MTPKMKNSVESNWIYAVTLHAVVMIIRCFFAKVKETLSNWQDIDVSKYSDVPEFCHSVKLYDADLTEEERTAGVKTIESNDWSLISSKYIEFIDHDMEIDYETEMKRIQSEMKQVLAVEKKSQSMLEEAFRGIGYGIE